MKGKKTNDADSSDSSESTSTSRETGRISYTEALRRLEIVADSQPLANLSDQQDQKPPNTQEVAQQRSYSPSLDDPGRVVSILDAVGCTSINTIHAPCPTPYNDISSTDGFAVASKLTEHASTTKPIRFKIVDRVAAEDTYRSTLAQEKSDAEEEDSEPQCIEIMIGARFPTADRLELDAVADTDDVEIVREKNRPAYILVSKPVARNQNKRSAGYDFGINQVVLWAGEKIKPKHIMGLAAIGMSEVEVVATNTQSQRQDTKGQPRVAILSTGPELVDITKIEHKEFVAARQYENATPDSSGPYVVSALKCSELTFDTRYLGVIPDDEEEVVRKLQSSIKSETLDVLIVNGGVSMGRFNLLRRAIEDGLGGLVAFHGVNVRPSLSILFAVVTVPLASTSASGDPVDERNVAIFGLPDNPVAAAAAVRFFVIPYMIMLRYGCLERPFHWAKLQASEDSISSSKQASVRKRAKSVSPILEKTDNHTVFWTAKRTEGNARNDADGAESNVVVLADQSSCSIKSLVEANCWVIAKEGDSTYKEGDEVAIASLL